MIRRVYGKHELMLQTVLKIMLDVADDHGDWERAFKENLPPRYFFSGSERRAMPSFDRRSRHIQQINDSVAAISRI